MSAMLSLKKGYISSLPIHDVHVAFGSLSVPIHDVILNLCQDMVCPCGHDSKPFHDSFCSFHVDNATICHIQVQKLAVFDMDPFSSLKRWTLKDDAISILESEVTSESVMLLESILTSQNDWLERG